jgi:hypothetical protein
MEKQQNTIAKREGDQLLNFTQVAWNVPMNSQTLI